MLTLLTNILHWLSRSVRTTTCQGALQGVFNVIVKYHSMYYVTPFWDIHAWLMPFLWKQHLMSLDPPFIQSKQEGIAAIMVHRRINIAVLTTVQRTRALMQRPCSKQGTMQTLQQCTLHLLQSIAADCSKFKCQVLRVERVRCQDKWAWREFLYNELL